MKTIQDYMDSKQYGVVFILARYFYRIGEPVISDAYYDKLEELLKEYYYDTFKEYFERTYDDDPIPYEFLEEMGIKPIVPTSSTDRVELYNYLNEDKSFSIASVTEYSEAFNFFSRLREEKLDFCVSLKVDGVNTKNLYVDDRFALSLSRGRGEGDSFDYTDNEAKVIPPTFSTGQKIMKVTGESYVMDEGLVALRKKYHKPDGYVSGKSAAISMLRVAHEREDYCWLKTRIFSAEGIADTMGEMFEKLQIAGFDVVPYVVWSWKSIPEDFDEFKVWLKKSVFDMMWEKGKGIPSDGVVVEVNDLNWVGTQHNQYVSRQLALKFEQWSYQVYEGIITDIKIEQRRVNKSVRVEIEPLKTSDGAKARIINSFNPAILIHNDLYVGKKVYFERNSNAFNSVIHGERLQELLNSKGAEEVEE